MPKFYKIEDDCVYEEQNLKDIDFSDSFFDSFKEAYLPYYSVWLQKKKDDKVTLVSSGRKIIGFLKVKIEDESEDYMDIIPLLNPSRRLKISSFKVADHNHEVSNNLYKKVLEEALKNHVDEIYATFPTDKSYSHEIESFLAKRGFSKFGTKVSNNIVEYVYILTNIKSYICMFFNIYDKQEERHNNPSN